MAFSIIPAAEPVLRLDLEKGGPGRVLGPMALSLVPGETVALTGPSGAGKTSLLRIVAGLDRRFEGRLEATERVAMVFQEPVLLPWRTALQNLTIVARVSEIEARHWMEEVGLAGLGGRFPGMLSLGQQRRLSLARAFASRPDLLLMDEPFVSLDPVLADEMMSLFERLITARPCATLLVTHVRAEAQRLAGRILRLEGRPARLVEEDQKAGAYFQLSASGVTTSRS
ncbi:MULTISPECIES: ABC transporter ATP-binding protein [unclassified Shinella]|jgi:NitT/TauT family transport system ATP-binding protein|uniref:ABC transporter ATP-binding protein n=1 Tax=unclassified Shinella TaxID=2643062 RepID=UPI000680869E|nr:MULTISPECIES: ATP-binding cassette domain-containing protein [unclassified Shinella]KNY14237.1 ABC transporter ATP-binding protein [Shinella sp. SUS2]KOC73950.1 ABC transporter ATP-binding protein [Shinella sp. GWS1]MCO5151914.1 ATP-binding cassette domain-containing protein [Shinella sp.]MDC7265516.1 ATP-binding cassette domain-containing protein [Shinella sp. HY16]MDC7272413.1 ATP-binding cassette domain-containing protein [Shinella sp. YZ44]